jgi:hypothetical protein
MPWLRRTRGPERILVPAPEYFLVRRRGATRPFALFLAVFHPSMALYLQTLAPTVTAEDSGELITAAYTCQQPPTLSHRYSGQAEPLAGIPITPCSLG